MDFTSFVLHWLRGVLALSSVRGFFTSTLDSLTGPCYKNAPNDPDIGTRDGDFLRVGAFPLLCPPSGSFFLDGGPPLSTPKIRDWPPPPLIPPFSVGPCGERDAPKDIWGAASGLPLVAAVPWSTAALDMSKGFIFLLSEAVRPWFPRCGLGARRFLYGVGT